MYQDRPAIAAGRERGRKLFRHRYMLNYYKKYLDNILPLFSQRAVPELTLPILSRVLHHLLDPIHTPVPLMHTLSLLLRLSLFGH
jgi:hypothetical protein